MEEQNRYTLSYRVAETRQVMGWISAGQCGCLIGLRGAGKSNFFHFLLREDVRQHYLGHEHSNFALVYLDLLNLIDLSSGAFYELVLDRLSAQFQQPEMADRSYNAVISLHKEITRNQDPLLTRQTAERYLNTLLQLPTQRLVFLIDEFDTAFGSINSSLFRYLRAARDIHKGRLIYIIAASKDLAYLRHDLVEVEHFYRLVSRNVCGLGPYGEADARQMVDFLAAQRSFELTAEEMTELIELSGGHAGLLNTILSLRWNSSQASSLGELTPTLQNEPIIQAECQKIWDSLPGLEQDALRALTSDSPVRPDALHHLKRKGLTREGSSLLVFSPLFKEFVRRQSPPPTKGVYVDFVSRAVHVDGRMIKDLTELEFELLSYLYSRRGQICTKDDLVKNVYRQRYSSSEGGITDQMLQTLISRLRKKIEPVLERTCYIVTARGEGYKLAEPGEK